MQLAAEQILPFQLTHSLLVDMSCYNNAHDLIYWPNRPRRWTKGSRTCNKEASITLGEFPCEIWVALYSLTCNWSHLFLRPLFMPRAAKSRQELLESSDPRILARISDH